VRLEFEGSSALVLPVAGLATGKTNPARKIGMRKI
jgi:hypothetical protein